MSAIALFLASDPELQALAAAFVAHFLASLTNAIVPDEPVDAGRVRTFLGKTLRALSLPVGNPTAKNAQ